MGRKIQFKTTSPLRGGGFEILGSLLSKKLFNFFQRHPPVSKCNLHAVQITLRTVGPGSRFVVLGRTTHNAPPLAIVERDEGLVLKSYSAFFNGKPICLKNASASGLVLAVVTMVTARENTSLMSSSEHSGKMVCSLIPIVMFPISSMAVTLRPRKSRVCGRAILMSLSRKCCLRAPRRVT